MSDLVQRLRAWMTTPYGGIQATAELMGEAADRIEADKVADEHRLAECDRLQDELYLMQKRMDYVAEQLRIEGMYNLADHLLSDEAALRDADPTPEQQPGKP